MCVHSEWMLGTTMSAYPFVGWRQTLPTNTAFLFLPFDVRAAEVLPPLQNTNQIYTYKATEYISG